MDPGVTCCDALLAHIRAGGGVALKSLEVITNLGSHVAPGPRQRRPPSLWHLIGRWDNPGGRFPIRAYIVRVRRQGSKSPP